MAQLSTILIVSALITNIYAHHDHLKLKHSLKRNNRDNSETGRNCTNAQLIFKYNSTSKFEYVYNQTGKVGLVSDTRIVIVFNNQTRVAIAIDYKSQMGVCFRNNTLNNWEEYFSSVTNLKVVEDAAREIGETFNTTSIPANVSQEVKPILKSLSPNYSNISEFLKDAQSSCAALQLYSGVFKDIRSRIYGDFHSLSQRLTGINDFFKDLRSRIHLNDTNFNLGKILNQRTGADVLGSLLKELRSNHTLEDILGESAHSPSRLLSQISSLGGGANPADTLFQIFSHFFQMGTTPIRMFISTIIHFFGAGRRGFTQFVSGARNLAQIFTRFGNVPSGFQNFVQSLSNRSGSINGFNASEILDILRNRNSNSSIPDIVHFFSLLSSRIPLQESIPTFLGQLISLYQNQDNSTLENLIPNFDLNDGLDSESEGAQGIVGDFLKLFQTGVGAFAHFPIFLASIPLRFFIIPISSALAQFSNSSFLGIFQSQNSLQLLQQAIQSGSGFGSGDPLSGFQNTIENVANGLGNVAGNGNKTGNPGSVENLANIGESIVGSFQPQDKRAQVGKSKKVGAAPENLVNSFGDTLGKGSGFAKNVITQLSHREKKYSHNELHHYKGSASELKALTTV